MVWRGLFSLLVFICFRCGRLLFFLFLTGAFCPWRMRFFMCLSLHTLRERKKRGKRFMSFGGCRLRCHLGIYTVCRCGMHGERPECRRMGGSREVSSSAAAHVFHFGESESFRRLPFDAYQCVCALLLWRKEIIREKYCLPDFFFILSVCLALTYSRGAWISLAGIVLGLAVFYDKRFGLVFLAVPLILFFLPWTGGGALYFSFFPARIHRFHFAWLCGKVR